MHPSDTTFQYPKKKKLSLSNFPVVDIFHPFNVAHYVVNVLRILTIYFWVVGAHTKFRTLYDKVCQFSNQRYLYDRSRLFGEIYCLWTFRKLLGTTWCRWPSGNSERNVTNGYLLFRFDANSSSKTMELGILFYIIDWPI